MFRLAASSYGVKHDNDEFTNPLNVLFNHKLQDKFQKTIMKQLATIILLITSISFNCHSQSQTDKVALEICGNIANVSLDQSSEILNNKIIGIIQSTYLRHQ